MADVSTLLQSVIDLLDVLVELFLGFFVKPLVRLDNEVRVNMNEFLRKILDDNKRNIPQWLTAEFVAYARALLVIPTILLLAWDQFVLSAVLVVLVDLAGVLHCVVARFWVDAKRDLAEYAIRDDDRPITKAIASSENEEFDIYEFEVVTTGSPQRMKSWSLNHRNRTYSVFLDAVCEKAYTVPCWIYLLSTVPLGQFRSIQYVCLWWLILTETANGCLQFKTFFAAGGAPPCQVEGAVLSSRAVTDIEIIAVKQNFELLGTALFVLPFLRYLGMILLMLACPLAYESFRRKSKQRVIYVVCTKSEKFDFKTIKFWNQAKALGTKLIVGVVGKNQPDMVCNACSSASVDEVIAEAPAKADLIFLERQQIDYVVFLTGQTGLVTDEVIAMGACLVLGDDHVARPLNLKEDTKKA